MHKLEAPQSATEMTLHHRSMCKDLPTVDLCSAIRTPNIRLERVADTRFRTKAPTLEGRQRHTRRPCKFAPTRFAAPASHLAHISRYAAINSAAKVGFTELPYPRSLPTRASVLTFAYDSLGSPPDTMSRGSP